MSKLAEVVLLSIIRHTSDATALPPKSDQRERCCDDAEDEREKGVKLHLDSVFLGSL